MLLNTVGNPGEESIQLVICAIFKDCKKFIAAVTPHEAEIQGGQVENVGKIPNQDISGRMIIKFVHGRKIGKIYHHTCQIVRKRCVIILFNDRITAETVRDTGQWIGICNAV